MTNKNFLKSFSFIFYIVLFYSNFSFALTCSDLDGASVYSQESTPVYLGFFGSQFASESIMNLYGTYGSQFNALSVRNTYGNYGSPFLTYSANNDYTLTPPKIYKNGIYIAHLTTNNLIQDGYPLSSIDETCVFYSSYPSNPTVTVPLPPSTVIASDGAYTDIIQLYWPAVTYAEKYKVYYSESAQGDKYFIAETTLTTMDITGGEPGKIYYFWITSVNIAGEGSFSNPDSGFVSASQYTLTITKSGTGSGTVSGDGTYAAGSTQSITAIAETDSSFINWTGDCSGTSSTLSVLIDRNKICTAVFNLNGTEVIADDTDFWTLMTPIIINNSKKQQ